MDLIGLLVFLLILGLVYWIAHRIVAAAGMPSIAGVIVDVVLVIVLVMWLTGAVTVPPLRLGR